MAQDLKRSFHEQVAERLIEQLQEGTAPWQRPWNPDAAGSLPMNPTTGKRYKGINAIQLMSQGREDTRWMTYRQAAAEGAQVRKGEHGTPIQFWQFTLEQERRDDQGRPMLTTQGEPIKDVVKLERPRVFFATVFNAEQIEGLPPQQRTAITWNPIERAESILKASGADVRHVPGSTPHYRPATDSIQMPSREEFPSAANYYATAMHELGHWTGHATRLDRNIAHPYGSQEYAKEELRAEIASMTLGNELGIGHDPNQHAAYVGSWIKALQDDPLEIFRAAADAEKIHEFVLALEQKQEQAQTNGHEVREQNQEATMQQHDEGAATSNRAEHRANEASEKPARAFLDVPFKEKEQAKALGAKWDRNEQAWFVPAGVDSAPFERWQPRSPSSAVAQNEDGPSTAVRGAGRQQQTYLAVPYSERASAKAAGALWDKAAKSWYVGPSADIKKLERWLPENVSSQQAPAMTPREEFAQALRNLGCVVDGSHPEMDGKPHRVPVEGDKRGEKAGFYVGHQDGVPNGYIKNNRTGVDFKWVAKGYSLDPEEKAKLAAESAQKLQARAEELADQHEKAAGRVQRQLTKLLPPTEPTAYMKAKGIAILPGAYTDAKGEKTYIPAVDTDGRQWTMQYIQEDGTKRFAKGSRKDGCFHPIGGLAALADAPAVVIAEGYATAATLTSALGFGAVAAFDAGNVPAVAQALRSAFPDKPIVIAGDNDLALEQREGVNPGRAKAEEAARLVGGRAMFPVFAPGEATKLTDWNDLANKSKLGPEAAQRQVRIVVDREIERHDSERQQALALQHQQRRPRAMRV